MNSSADRRGLGRGLGELFQRTDEPGSRPGAPETSPASSPTVTQLPQPTPEGAYFADIPAGSIRPNPKQPRTAFDEEALQELTESILEVGLLQPIVVRPLDGGAYELVMGERRWRAAQRAGLENIPAIVRRTEQHDLLRDALLENLHRAQLNPLEEAAAYQQMLEDFGCTQEELSVRIKRSRPQISNTIRLLKLPPTVQRRVAAGVLSAGHARALLAVESPAGQERLAQRVVSEGLSVRTIEELVTLDETGGADPVRRRTTRPEHPRAHEVAEELGEFLETRVRVDAGRSKGRIVIEFGGLDDLERIVKAIVN